MKTNDTKYTEKFVLNEVKSILNDVKKDISIIYLKTIFDNKEYTHQRYSEWTKNFKNNREITDTIKKTKEILESRINNQGLRGELNTAMVIFNLKNNYGWKDKQEVESKNENINYSLENIPTEKLEKIKDLMK